MRSTTAIQRWLGGAKGALGRAARRAAHIATGQYFGYSLISPVLSGVVVTPQTALTLTAYYAGINVISTDVAKLPRLVYRATKGGGKAPATDDPRFRLLARKPNAEMNAVRFWQHAMGHALGWGNHYSEIVLDDRTGLPTALWPLNPGTTKPRRDEKTKALIYVDEETGKKLLPEQVLHIAGLGFDGIMGYSPATMARQAIGLGIAAEQFGASLFGNGAIPKGLIETPKKLTDQAAKRLRESWENVHGGTLNANRTAILEEGMTWKSTQISPDDAQFLATRKFQVEEIARLFNLPPHKLGDFSHAHLANLEESNLDYLGSTLMGWLVAIEAEINAKLFFESEEGAVFCQHELSALMRGNMGARSNYYSNLFRMGAISPNEIRDKEGLNPIPNEAGGDQYLVQAQLVPLDQAGQAMAAKAGAGDNGGGDAPAVDETPDSAPGVGDTSEISNNSLRRPGSHRYNHNHGPDGKFASGGSGSIGSAVAIARDAGVAVEPRGHAALKEQFGAPLAEQVAAAYNPKDKKIYINERSSFWKDAAANMAEANKVGWLSSSAPDHPIHHEIGHALHDAADPANFKALGSKAFPADHKAYFARHVSRYAASGPIEMVAEVYAGKKAGKTYPDGVMSYYDALGGPSPTP
jgi:HK97 family phage portal protein